MDTELPIDEALFKYFRDTSSEIILARLASGKLNTDAVTLARAELSRRGIPLPDEGDSPGLSAHAELTLEPAPELDARKRAEAMADADSSMHGETGQVPPPLPASHDTLGTGVARSGSWLVWLGVFVVSLILLASFGLEARNSADGGFLLGAIFLQALAITGVLRVFVSILGSSSTLSVLVKIGFVAALLFAIFVLTVVSSIARHGLGG
ncbi:hypothetical protein EC912_10541 [Luteibacter rhizovicinus]|uniref:Uncharacterized protein n=1 Tax=Luteibacter rhizovicinus TaxID=242606 RepID=A0A4R3YLS5_9GAMM|nr:hypothetical protein [Luteibacter rhizovicinus]TCV93181.1 hypothetical protein EC912_10541 [Luteibacter rhizovicinus]